MRHNPCQTCAQGPKNCLAILSADDEYIPFGEEARKGCPKCLPWYKRLFYWLVSAW